MKKIIITLLIIVGLTGCGVTTYKEITYDEFKSKIENKEDFILFIGSETCSACSAYKFTVNKIVENYHLKINYIDISKLSDSELGELKSVVNFNGTPTTAFITNGKEDKNKKRIVGNQKYSKVVQKFKDYGYIKEK